MHEDTAIYLNQLAQQLTPLKDGIDWFERQMPERQKEILRELVYFVCQSHPLPSEVPAAIALAGLKPTYTPCVLVSKPDYQKRMSQLLNLPRAENTKSFRLLIGLLSIADARRRQKCGNACHHWWHKHLKRTPSPI